MLRFTATLVLTVDTNDPQAAAAEVQRYLEGQVETGLLGLLNAHSDKELQIASFTFQPTDA